MAAKLNKGVLVGLLQDPEVKAQLEALIVELLGKDKGALLLAILAQIQGGQNDVPVKKSFWAKLGGWIITLLPFIKSFFTKKK